MASVSKFMRVFALVTSTALLAQTLLSFSALGITRVSGSGTIIVVLQLLLLPLLLDAFSVTSHPMPQQWPRT